MNSDWDFNGNTPHILDSIHPYPAKFIREIPKKLLKSLLPSKDLLVYDPFCGSGTTLVVAQEMGYNVLGVDLNPIACLMSRVKTSPLFNKSNFDFDSVVETAKANVNYGECFDIKNVDHWFIQHVSCEIASITRAINLVEDINIANILKLALSSIIVRVSNQESDTRYAAIKKDISKGTVYSLFETAFHKITNALEHREYSFRDATVIEQDTLKFDDPRYYQQVGITITSPPYPNAYEYWLYHKYRMYWLGYDPLKVKESEIGARAHFFKKNHHTEHNFAEQMSLLLAQIKNFLVPHGFACFVVGRSKIHGKLIDNAQLIVQAGKEKGFKLVGTVDRNIQSTRKSFNLSHANIKKEKIVILKNEN